MTGCSLLTNVYNVSISNLAPTQKPVISGPSNVCVSETSGLFTSTAVAAAVTYTWDLDGSGAVIVAGIGTTNITVDFSASTTGNYSFTVFGSNGCGNGPVSDAFSVTIEPGPQITTQPVDAIHCEGDDAVFSVVATGPGISYQWQEDSGSGFNNIIGEVNATLTLSGVGNSLNGNSYQVVISNPTCPSLISSTALLTVSVSASITTQPTNQSGCIDDTITFSVVAANETGYQWEFSVDGGTTFVSIVGETLPDLILNNTQLVDDGNQYRVIISNAGCPSLTSAAVLLTIADCTPPDCSLFTVRVDNTENASCNQSDGSFTLVPEGGSPPYTVEIDRNDGSGFIQSSPDITGLGPGTYNYRVTDINVCQFEGIVTISELQLIATFSEVTNANCSGENGSMIITVENGPGSFEYSIDNQSTWNSFVSGVPVSIAPGIDYTVIVRDVTAEFCPANSDLITILDPSMISFTIGAIIESVPERSNGSIDFTSISGGNPGTDGYLMDIELVIPTAPDRYQPQIVDRVDIPIIPGTISGTYDILLEDLFAGFYQIFIRDSIGCEIEVLSSTGEMAEVVMDDNLFIPNVFTPNGDGVNDFFFIRNMPEDVPTSVVISTRWGKEVYSNSNYNNEWDGAGLADDVYYYTIDIERSVVKGWVEVWRGTR